MSPVSQIFRSTFRSLGYANFRLYFFGQLVSLSGTWMQSVALQWLVYRTTHDSRMLGLVDAAQLAPIFLFGLLAGTMADRFDRRRLLLLTQFLAMVQSLVLAALTLSQSILPWHMIALSFFLGTLNAFEVPSRQAFLIDLVERKDLVNAISLNSLVFSLARSLGPALAGVLVIYLGEGGCFVLNGISYSAALTAIWFISSVPRAAQKTSAMAGIAEALRFVTDNKDVRRVLLQGVMLSIFGLQYSVLMPIFAAEILGGGVSTLGALRGAAGLGALLSALILAYKGTFARLRLGVGICAFAFGVSLLALSLSTQPALSALLVFALGGFMTAILSGGHSLVQLSVPDQLRGRVMSIYMTVMLGIAPLGSIVFGLGAHHFGVRTVTIFCAGLCLVTGLVYLFSLRSGQGETSPELII
jgi:MFS family permease